MNRKYRILQSSTYSKAPGYFVTYSDMVTLMLTFFVLLLAFSQVQDAAMFDATRDSFVNNINYMGFGNLAGKKLTPQLAENKSIYYIENPDTDANGRTLDSKEEDIRRMYKKVAQSMATMPSQIVSKKTDFAVTNICFAGDKAELDLNAKNFLTQFAADLQQKQNASVRLYVLGLAGGQQTAQMQWIVSAKRAQIAADFLKSILPAKFQYRIYSWGAGPGGFWVNPDSAISEKAQILIAVLRDDRS